MEIARNWPELGRSGCVGRRREILAPDTVIVPIPIHWMRLLKRRYNQAALLAQQLARISGSTCLPDALSRTRQTKVQDGMSVPARFSNMQDAFVRIRNAAGNFPGARLCWSTTS